MIRLDDPDVRIHHGDALEVLRTLPDESVHCCVTSPPFYGLRDYGTGEWNGGDEACDHLAGALVSAKSGLRNDGREHVGPYDGEKAITTGMPYRDVCGKCGARRVDQQIGLEATPDQWCASLVAVFREVRRVLRADGTLWVEIGDSYSAQGRTDKAAERDSFECGYPDCECQDICRATGREVGRKAEFRERGQTRGYAPGSNWSNYGSSTRSSRVAHGTKPKDLVGAPWLLAFALRADGWYLRSDIIWHRPNPMPESVTDRPTKSHSYVFLLAKSPRYYYDADAIREEVSENTNSKGPKPRAHDLPKAMEEGHGIRANNSFQNATWDRVTARNKRSVWTIATQPLPFQHYAAFPEKLVEPCVLAGTSERGVCSVCGAPWEREVERAERPDIGPTDGSHPNQLSRQSRGGGNGEWKKWREENPDRTTGWRPTCNHQAPTVPATVLDPFLGSGTTAIVARRLGRRCVGIELNERYCQLAASRLAQQSLFAQEVPA